MRGLKVIFCSLLHRSDRCYSTAGKRSTTHLCSPTDQRSLMRCCLLRRCWPHRSLRWSSTRHRGLARFGSLSQLDGLTQLNELPLADALLAALLLYAPTIATTAQIVGARLS